MASKANTTPLSAIRLMMAVQANFQAQETVFQLEKGHGRIENGPLALVVI